MPHTPSAPKKPARAPSARPRLFFVGIPLGAHVLLARGHQLVGAAIGPLDLPGRRRLRRLLGPHAPLLGLPDLSDPAVQELILACAPDALLSYYWPKQIPATLLARFPLGAYGTHPSLLPRWRGPDPFFWAVASGEPETGVSLHHLAAEYDTGAVVATRTLAITAEDTAWSLARRIDRPALALLDYAASELRKGEPLPGVEQDESRASAAPSPNDEDLAIDWRRPADEVLRLIRAASPSPGATAAFGEALVEISAARACAPLPGLSAAEAWITEAGNVGICCGAGAIEVLGALDEEGKELDAEALLALSRDEPAPQNS